MNAAQLLRIYDTATKQMIAQESFVLEQEYIDSAIRAEGLNKSKVTAEARDLLRTSAVDLSGDEIEALLILAGDLIEFEGGITTLNALLLLRNHYKHEDIVRSLQRAADSKSVPYLIATIQSEQVYAPWDDGKELVRKCFWALAAIGSDEAWQTIQSYSNSNDQMIAQWADEQLDRH